MTAILGISAFYHDSAAALVVDGEIVAAAQEERFSRKKNDAAFPSRSVQYCLSEAGLNGEQLDYVVFYDKPIQKFERLLETYLAFAPAGFGSFKTALPGWLRGKLSTRKVIREHLGLRRKVPIVFPEHHESHAASAFFPSPYEEAAIITMDGVGEWTTTSYGVGRGNRIQLLARLSFPHSLGLLYSAFTYYCGFKVNEGEYKLMGLAPYGTPRFKDAIINELMHLEEDGSYWLDMRFFNYCQGLTMTNERFDLLFGGPPRRKDEAVEQRHMDLAASVQAVTEEVIFRLADHVHKETGLNRLVLAGGVSLNCVANGKLLQRGPFEDIWIQPAAGDAGGALGAALFAWHQLLDGPRQTNGEDSQKRSLLGPEYSDDQIENVLSRVGASFRRFDNEEELLDDTVEALTRGEIVGWFQGRLEYGPRALGSRSILGDARSPKTQTVMNLKTKFRESFRPFAPVTLRSKASEWFDVRPGLDSPYMLLVAPVREQHRANLSDQQLERMEHSADLFDRVNVARSSIPAVTHVDFSARLQTVDERNGRYYRLLELFDRRTGCPVLVNTSFNLSWEPIVQSPEEAYRTFMQSAMDVLVIGSFVLRKKEQSLGIHFGLEPGNPVTGNDGERGSPWADPVTGEALIMTETEAVNAARGNSYPVEERIPRLFVLEDDARNAGVDVTELVKSFYEENPFPNYENLEGVGSLLEKARAGLFARLLNEQIPFNARVLEVGCGTGQLTNFLGIARRSVLGVDICLNSLKLAEGFRQRNGLDNVAFAQMNLFRPALKTGFFDVVISNGVLHHTADPARAYEVISTLVRPGGHLVVGLYNGYSRSLHGMRRGFYRTTGVMNRFLDPHFADISAEGKHKAWLQDQYHHPHEHWHTLDEVLRWIDRIGFEYVNSIPKPTLDPALEGNESLFEARSRGDWMSRIASQVASLKNGYREGGFFIVIARRKESVS